MKRERIRYFILFSLFVLFVTPGLLAYLVYQHPNWLHSTRTNRGEFIQPPVHLSLLEGKDKWHMIYWSPESCGQVCFTQLDTLAKTRLALGRQLYQVNLWLILGEHAQKLSSRARALLKDRDIFVVEGAAEVSSKAYVFLADPKQDLILKYAVGVNPEDVYHDLKQLLSVIRT